MLIRYPRELPLNSAYAMPSGHITKQELLFDFSVILADNSLFFPREVGMHIRLKTWAVL